MRGEGAELARRKGSMVSAGECGLSECAIRGLDWGVVWRRLRLTSLSWMAAKEPPCNYCVAGGSCHPKRFCLGNAWFDFIELVLHVDFLVADVDVVLEIEEIAVADAEILAEAKGCVHRDLAFVAQDFLDARYRHMDVFRQPVRGNPHRLHEFFPEDFRHGRRWYNVFHVDHLLVNDNLQSVRHRNGCHCLS